MERSITFKIKEELQKPTNKVILLIGQRQVGKTTELRKVQKNYPTSQYFDFEDIGVQDLFQPSVQILESIVGDREDERIVLFDEIQYLNNAGSILKLLHDHFPQTKIIATGSATFLLLKNIGDSLYGRNIVFEMHPLTYREIVEDTRNRDFGIGEYNKLLNKPVIDAKLHDLLLYGSLPEVFLENASRKKVLLNNYITSLLFKDALEIEGIRMPQVFKNLLRLLALQIGSEINSNELATQLNIDRKTVLEYIGIYEKFKIIYVLSSFSTNERKEISKGFKIYFSDLGIRNALINNFVHIDNRTDTGCLFENLVINNLRQNFDYFNQPYKLHFWRTYTQSEVDVILTSNISDEIIPIEIKYNNLKQPSKSFFNEYKEKISRSYCINKDNLWKFI
ncbi:MAG: ATP-binding protein [Candidatus Dojkabacteria bacterium]